MKKIRIGGRMVEVDQLGGLVLAWGLSAAVIALSLLVGLPQTMEDRDTLGVVMLVLIPLFSLAAASVWTYYAAVCGGCRRFFTLEDASTLGVARKRCVVCGFERVSSLKKWDFWS